MSAAAIYPGTFDPVTLGHVDLIERASHIFDRVIVAVALSKAKSPLFDTEERVQLIGELVKPYPGVEVDSFDGLLVEYARARKVHVLIRGLRAFSDFEYEFQMTLTNRKLAPDIETIFLMPKEEYSYISSSVVREVAELGGNMQGFVPPLVSKAIMHKLKLDR